jgi:hypothetical protein
LLLLPLSTGPIRARPAVFLLFAKKEDAAMTMNFDERLKQMLQRRMREAVANPPQRAIARDLLARGLTPNEIHQLVVLDHAFDAVPYSFRVAVANAARELAAAPAARRRAPAGERRHDHA